MNNLNLQNAVAPPSLPGSGAQEAGATPVVTNSTSAKAAAKTVVYACSGCSDAGELADRIARQLTQAGVAEMSCLAGIGGRVKSIMAKGEKAPRVLVIDGCPLNCARKTLELAGLRVFEHLGLHDVGLHKGRCPVTEEHIDTGVKAAAQILATRV